MIKLRLALKAAYEEGLPVRAIVGIGQHKPGGDVKVNKRMLDPVPWAVVDFDEAGNCTLMRGASPVPKSSRNPDVEYDGFHEGEKYQKFVAHRRRENRARNAKINSVLAATGDHLICEVAACGFDFKTKCGALGEKYAHVHHLTPFSEAPDEGRKVELNDLVIVCANCHAMIHKGGECCSLQEVSGCIVG
jgi:5-methylcytosine-specific restriction protein A